MDFISNQQPQIEQMLESLGLSSIEELWGHIPKEILMGAPIEDDGLSEFEGVEEFKHIAKKNQFLNYDCYLGGGAYPHYVPAIVKSIILKSGFLTAYTPYQAEASQGLLQTIFEFQTAIARLTGLEIANASLYDGASAAAEAMIMAYRINSKRKKICIAENLHPHYKEVVRQYLLSLDIDVIELEMDEDGNLNQKKAQEILDEEVAGALFAYPNFFGGVEDLKDLITYAKEKEIVVALSSNPLVYGVYRSSKEMGADIAVGDCQPFGIPLQLGGPYAGYLACRKKFARQIPGRIVGRTQDRKGNSGFVLTLQTREQHIRREKATSNICSNQALFALASLVAMLWYGPKGIHKLALTNFQRTEYLKRELIKLPNVFSLSKKSTFNEFAIQVKDVKKALKEFEDHKIIAGLDLEDFFPSLKNHLLINVTEVKNLEQINRYIEVAKKVF